MNATTYTLNNSVSKYTKQIMRVKKLLIARGVPQLHRKKADRKS